jgi:hypothetical protein
MGRYVLRYAKAPLAPEAHVKNILGTPGIRVIDKSPNMLLVDADEATLRRGMEGMQGWSIHSEQHYPLPDTRHKID